MPGARRLAIVGAGAAGLTAAIFAARRGARVTLYETRPRPGAKIRVSGGGRCNVLPSQVDVERDFFSSGSMRALRNVLLSWPLAGVTRFFTDELAIPLRTEASGKVFPASERPQDVIAALLGACEHLGVELVPGARVVDLERSGDGFAVITDAGARCEFDCTILATGGLSLPRTGSDGHGYAIARALGHEIAPTFPVLVPLVSPASRSAEIWSSLAGVALPVRARIVESERTIAAAQGDFLFTHRGFSGPLILDLSRWLASPDGAQRTIEIAWLGDAAPDWAKELARGGKRSVPSIVGEHLPRRLAAVLVELAGLKSDLRACDLCREGRDALVDRLTACELPLAGNEGYATAEATGGGIRLEDLHLKTLESRSVPGLHFAGEIIDVDGRIGGYNFLWAWVSGRRAGEGAAG